MLSNQIGFCFLFCTKTIQIDIFGDKFWYCGKKRKNKAVLYRDKPKWELLYAGKVRTVSVMFLLEKYDVNPEIVVRQNPD